MENVPVNAQNDDGEPERHNASLASHRNEAQLRDLYEQSKKFCTDMFANRGPSVLPIDSFEEFKNWWGSLDPSAQHKCSSDFAKGYDRTISDAQQRLAATENEV